MKEWRNLVQLGSEVDASVPDVDQAQIIGLVNIKGGVGKTTSAVNLAAGLSVRGRVLLVDLDAQRSATLFLGAKMSDRQFTMAEVLLGQVSVTRAIRTTGIPDLHLLQGGIRLSNIERHFADKSSRSFVLKDRLQPIRGRYDYIVIDCPPFLSLLTINALIASDAFIVPVVPQFLAVKAMEELLALVKKGRSQKVPYAPLMGILLTMVESNSPEERRVIDRMRQLYGAKIFDTEINKIDSLFEAPRAGKTIYEYATYSGASTEYWNLSKEVIGRCRSMQKQRVAVPDVEPEARRSLWNLLGKLRRDHPA